jgi:hypothetical protein
MKKVITSARLRTSEATAFLNTESRTRSIFVGARKGEERSILGFIAKVCEQTAGSSILDYSVWLDLSFPHVIGVFGTRGSGKSFDLGVLMECVVGVEEVITGVPPSSSVIVFDLQNQFWTLGLTPNPDLPEDSDHLEILKYWGLSPIALGSTEIWLPAGCTTQLPSVREFRLAPESLNDADWLALLELERYTPMGQALIALLSVNTDRNPAILAERAIPSRPLASFQQGTIDGLRWRLEALSGSQLVGTPGIVVDDILVSGKTSVILLRDLQESLQTLAVGVLTRLVSKRMSSSHQAKRVARRYGHPYANQHIPDRLWLIIDEAHVVVPADATTAATNPVVEYVKRGRDSGLSMVFATQQPSAVDRKLMSQVDITLTHALGFDSDLQAAIGRMPTRNTLSYELAGSRLSSMGDVIRSLDPGEAIIADAANGRAFLARLRPRLSAHGGHTPT